MGKLQSIPGAELRDAMAEVNDAKIMKRLMIAVAYKGSAPVSALSSRTTYRRRR
jgi:hypothetical protein